VILVPGLRLMMMRRRRRKRKKMRKNLWRTLLAFSLDTTKT